MVIVKICGGVSGLTEWVKRVSSVGELKSLNRCDQCSLGVELSCFDLI